MTRAPTASGTLQPDDWRRKYRDAICEVEAEARAWKALEDVLRRIVVRLCIAAREQDQVLDREIDSVARAMRHRAETPELEALLLRLSDAIVGLDHKQPPAAMAALPPPSRGHVASDVLVTGELLGSVLLRLLAPLQRLAPLRARVEPLLSRIHQAPNTGDDAVPAFSALFDEIVGLIGEQIARLELEKDGVQRILTQVTARLDEMATLIRGEEGDVQQSRESSLALSDGLLGEVQRIGADLRRTDDLASLQRQISDRVEAIGEHLQAFREREAARESQQLTRMEHMRKRVEDLECEASALSASLLREQHLASTDTLTGIPNRLACEERLGEEFRRFQLYLQPFAIAVWDIDRFKSINDRYGHKAGDKVLARVGQHLATQIRATDFVARYGGEEFMMLFAGVGTDVAGPLSERIRESVHALGFHFRGSPVGITLSCGITGVTEGDTADSLFERADQLLYAAKHAGRDRCRVG